MTREHDDDRGVPWLDEREPHEAAVSRAQIEGLERRLGAAPQRILDLGCGHGRLVIPLARAGHEVVGVDRDPRALGACRAALPASAKVTLMEADMLQTGAEGGPFDVVLCLGNTLMTIVDVDQAIRFFAGVRKGLGEGGGFFIDDCPADFWPEVTGGFWQDGLTEDGEMQLVWADSDAVFALRLGDDVDPSRETLEAGDRRFRLWTDGLLAVTARLAGLSAPERLAGEHMLVMRPE